jgi:amino acid adenylation domain-containing protein
MRHNSYSDKLWVAANQNLKAKNFWLKQLSGDLVKSHFPYDQDRPGKEKGTFSQLTFESPASVFSKLKKVTGNSDIKLHIILTAALMVLMQKYTDSTDIITGTPIYKQQIEGEFINTVLTLRSQFHQEMTFKEFLLQVKHIIMAAHENYNYPMEILVEQLNLQTSDDDFPLFDIAILLENIQDKNHINHIPVKMTFSFRSIEAETCIKGIVEYNSLFYEKNTIERIINHLKHLIDHLLFHADAPLQEVDILSADEKKQLLIEFNRTGIEEDYPADSAKTAHKTIMQLFERQVQETPGKNAVVFKNEVLTYQQLNERVNRAAWFLRKKGVTSDSIVGIMLEHPLEMLIGILAVWKAGGAYLPIGADYPRKRVISMLNDSHASLILTEEKILKRLSFTRLQPCNSTLLPLFITSTRSQVENIDSLQIPDRSLVNYEKYRPYIGQAVAKNSITVQFSRGCVYNCAFCFKVWPHKYIVRSAENLFHEIQTYYNMGIRRFAFVDDLPNLNIKNSSRFYELIIKHGMKVHFHFPNGIRGDILTKDHIDLMVEAGTVNMDLALETTSPRLQKLIRKRLNLEKLYENIYYIIEKHPQVILELQIIHGLPTETEEEAMASLDFIKNLKWVHFPYIHILNIYPNSAMAEIAMQHGISKEAIQRSADIAYHELPETLPFPKHFTKKYQSEFVSQYFMSKERLLAVLPHQMRVLTEDELVQKYNSYLPVDIRSFQDLLNYAGISRQEIKGEFLPENFGVAPDFNEKLKKHFSKTKKEPAPDALRLLLLDLSQYFSTETRIIYDVVEPPLGLMYLLTHLNRQFPGQIQGKIAKSRIDFDNYDQLKSLILEFKPQVIGVRSLNFYKEFFHQTISIIRQWGISVPIIAGGPYATSSYANMMQDHNIDLAVLGEGEITFAQLIGKIIENNHQLPAEETLKNIPGLAFIQQKEKSRQKKNNREIVIMDHLTETWLQESPQNPRSVNHPADLAYIIYTSGSTGTPKGVMIRHDNLSHQITGLQKRFNFDAHLNYMLLAAFTFDVSVMHICLPLTSGAKLFLIDELTRKDPLKLWQFIYDNKIDILNIVPAFMKALLENLEKQKFHFKYLFVGGDLFRSELYHALKQTFKAEKIINIYGPTETTINATLYECREENIRDIIPIGKPLLHYRAYILDRQLRLLPPGAGGELCFSGYCVARGYLNRPELTAEKFIRAVISHSALVINPSKLSTNDQGPMTNDRFYRTGDLARWQPDGNIQFLGRIDQQVKIRGFRIELGEIEKKLKNHKDIKEAIVIARQDKQGDKYLAAYIVTHQAVQDEEPLIPELKEYLSRELPDYMIPPHFVKLGKIPLNINGKVDKNALPKPERTNKSVYTPPRNLLEETLVNLWSHVIGIERAAIGIDTNFFELGGHSLKATILISKIHKELDVKVPLVELFKTPFIRGLAEYIKEAQPERYVAIKRIEKKSFYALSSPQERLFILQQLEPDSTWYNMPAIMELEGKVNRMKLKHTFEKLIDRHESFRTSFEIIDDIPVQKVHPQVQFEMEGDELATEDTEKNSFDPKSYIKNFIRPFILSQAPLLRVGLMKTGGAQYLFMVDMHHIITDGISLALFLKDFLELYEGKDLPHLSLHYKDYAQWQNNQKENETMKKQQDYWLQQFKEEIPLLDLPCDYPRPVVQHFVGNHINFELSPTDTDKLDKLALAGQATLFMVLLSVFNILLAKLCRQEDIVVGTPIAGRQHPDLQNIIGMFVNTLPLRNFPHRQRSFTGFLRMVKERTLAAYENQDYPFEDLVDQVVKDRDPGRNPLFDVMFALNNVALEGGNLPKAEIPGLKLKPYNQENLTSKFDMSLFAYERDNQLFFMVEYCTSLFTLKTITRFIDYFKTIISSILRSPEQELGEIEIISEKEKNQVLEQFNNTKSEYPRYSTIHRLFSEQAAQIPDTIALVYKDAHLSYCQLNQNAAHLAGMLKEKGVTRNDIVGIMADHSLEMIIGVLGVLAAGGAYLPVNPTYPQKRKKYMLTDSHVNILLSNQADAADDWCGAEVIDLDNPETYSRSEYFQGVSRFDDIAYIIYTSGSTGNPKGVIVEHRSVVRLIKNTNYIKFHKRDRLMQTGALEFDASTFEIWGTLLNGSQLYLVDKDIIINADQLKQVICNYDIRIMWMTSPLFNRMLQIDIEIFAGLKTLLVGGDVLSPTHINQARRRFPGLKVINGYGPTENTTFSTTYLIHKEHQRNIPIGKPISNSTAYIIDQSNKILSIGIPGELILGGDGMARGYLNNPELTAEKFDHNLWDLWDYQDKKINYMSLEGTRGLAPLSKKEGTRGSYAAMQFPRHRSPQYPITPSSHHPFYRTGDLARWLPDGNIEFLGRIDQQIKLRGFRIELGEIESQLINQPHIKEAVVIPIENNSGDKQLSAYVVCEQQQPPRITQLKEFLAKILPDYMIPSYFVILDRIPLTPNGKIDRKALPTPEIQSDKGYIAPRNEVEKKLVEIWSGILGHPVGINDNFFKMGGHSLKATILMSKIYRELNVNVPVITIFKKPTIRQLAQYIKSAKKETTPIKDDYMVLLKKKSVKDRHLFFIHDGTGEVEGYIEFCDHLSAQFNCWGIRAAKIENYTPQNLSIQEVARLYIPKIKSLQPHGPYYIVGWSIGGTIAFEMTRQLEQQQEKIDFLALIDTLPPDKNLLKQGIEFNPETEVNLIRDYFQEGKIKKRLENAFKLNINGIWPEILDYMTGKENEFYIKIIKDSLPKGLAKIIPNFQQLGLKDLIYYLNMVRTFDNARNKYIPQMKINAKVHFFKASEETVAIDAEKWNLYCQEPMRLYKIPGDHVSILKKPHLVSLAKLFDNLIRGAI